MSRQSLLGGSAVATLALTGCIAGTLRPSPDAGRDADRADVTVDAPRKPVAEASCAVDAGTLSDAEVALGFAIISARKCFDCHGPQLAGNQDGVASPTAVGGLAYPPNLTPDTVTGLGCWTNAQITNAFLNGIDNQGQPLCAPMPHFGALGDAGIDDAQAAAVVEYLRSVPSISRVVPNTPSCPDKPPVEAGTDAPTTDAADAAGADASDAHGDAVLDAATDVPDGGVDAIVEGGADAGTDAGGASDADAGD